MSELSNLFKNTHRYLVSYVAYAGEHNEFEIHGDDCRIVSDRELTGQEIAEEVAHYIREQDGVPVSQVVVRKVGQLTN